MNRIKKPAGGQPTGTDGNGTKNSRDYKTNCTPFHNGLSSLDYLALMRQAETPADYLSAFSAFLRQIEVGNG